MLWVFIDNTGTVLCDVNVGNRIRQGNDFDVFVCFQGQPVSTSGESGTWTEDTSIWGLRNITYIKPTASGLEGVYASDPQQAAIQFKLGTPSQANTQFIGGNYYQGWLVHISKEATTFRGKGGHMTLMFSMKDLAHAGDTSYDQYAKALSIFIEPTYGEQPSMLTLTDYDTLMALVRNSVDINLGAITDESDLDEYYCTMPTEDNPDPRQPNSFYTYVYNGVPYFLFVAHDDNWVTYQQKIGFDASSEAQYMTASQRNNAGGEWSEWVSIDQLTITNITDTPSTDQYGMVTHHISIYVYGAESPYSFDIKNGVGIQRLDDEKQTGQYGLVTTVLSFLFTDGTSKTVSIKDGVGIQSSSVAESSDDGGENTLTLTFTNGDTKTLTVRNGRKGSPALDSLGFAFVIPTNDPNDPNYYLTLGLSSQDVNSLVMFYPQGNDAISAFHLVSSDPSSSEYYETLGVPASMVGSLIYIPVAGT